MDRLFGKKSKKSLKSPQTHTSLGIPANIAAGPLGFRTELDIDPKGEQGCSYHDFCAGRPDLAGMMPDENDTMASRITALRDNKSEDRGLPSMPEPSTIDAVGDKHGNGPTSQYLIDAITADVHSHLSPCQKGALATLTRKGASERRRRGVCVDASMSFAFR